jgi:hypothetical protein
LIDDDYLTAVRQRLDAATGGPWLSHIEGRDFLGGSSTIETAGEWIEMSGATDADQDFIAHARQDVEILLNEVIRLRKLTAGK